jgi:hypothetical protein
MAYVRLARLQRTLESTRRALLHTRPALPRGAAVKFWNLPRLAEVGFQGSSALRVWYRDSTLTWDRFGGVGNLNQHVDALVEYRDFAADPATVIEPAAYEAYFEAGRALLAGRPADADSMLARGARATRTRGPLYGSIALNRAWLAIDRGDLAGAEAFARDASTYGGQDADYWALVARIALLHRDPVVATAAARQCLALDPRNSRGLEILALLERKP